MQIIKRGLSYCITLERLLKQDGIPSEIKCVYFTHCYLAEYSLGLASEIEMVEILFGTGY